MPRSVVSLPFFLYRVLLTLSVLESRMLSLRLELRVANVSRRCSEPFSKTVGNPPSINAGASPSDLTECPVL